MKKAVSITLLIVRIVLVAAVGALAVFNVYLLVQRYAFHNEMPLVFGYASATVVSGSMEPEINVGDFVIVHRQDSYEVGDVISFENGGVYTTHEIVRIEDGKFITKGTNNEAEDPSPVEMSQVVGKVVAVWRNFGNVIDFFRTPAGIFVLVVAVVVIWLVLDAVSSIRRRKKEKDES